MISNKSETNEAKEGDERDDLARSGEESRDIVFFNETLDTIFFGWVDFLGLDAEQNIKSSSLLSLFVKSEESNESEDLEDVIKHDSNGSSQTERLKSRDIGS